MTLVLSLSRKSSLIARDETLQRFFIVVKGEKKRGCTLFWDRDSSAGGITDFCVILLKWACFVSFRNIAIS